MPWKERRSSQRSGKSIIATLRDGNEFGYEEEEHNGKVQVTLGGERTMMVVSLNFLP